MITDPGRVISAGADSIFDFFRGVQALSPYPPELREGLPPGRILTMKAENFLTMLCVRSTQGTTGLDLVRRYLGDLKFFAVDRLRPAVPVGLERVTEYLSAQADELASRADAAITTLGGPSGTHIDKVRALRIPLAQTAAFSETLIAAADAEVLLASARVEAPDLTRYLQAIGVKLGSRFGIVASVLAVMTVGALAAGIGLLKERFEFA